MSSLQVLCPNGRRQNVKTTPNTKLLQVLEDVCHKQKFFPAEDYKLVHGRTTLDLTLSVRFSNLANNAKLELVKAEKSRAESEVVIALQLEGGERLQHAFSPSTTLWDILRHWETVSESKVQAQLTTVDNTCSPAKHPVCIYMTEEVCGENVLRNTQLRKLGLLGGRAVIRFVKRPVDDKLISKSAEKITKEQKQDKNISKTTQLTGSDVRTESSTSVTETQSNSSNIVTQNTVMETQSGTRIVASTSAQNVKNEMATISLNINVNIQNDNKPTTKERDEHSEEPASKIVKTDHPQDLSEPMEVEHPDVHDSVMETEDSVKEPVVPSGQTQQEAVEGLRNIPGLEVFTPQDFLDLSSDQQQVAQQLAAALLPKLRQMQGQQVASQKPKSVKQKALPPSQTSFTDFKFPEATKGKQLYKNDMSEYKKEDFKPCERKTIVYSLMEKQEDDGDDNTTSITSEDVPQDFFQLTESDIRSLVSAQKKKLDELENQPLMTLSMRKAKLESIYSKYDQVVIRIQFTDKHILQAFFRPRETVYAVQKFVKENLKSKDIPFYLYTSPPKCVLKDESQTLIEAQLVPATIVYFGSSQQEDHYLSDSCLSNIKSRLDADILATECLRSSDSNDNDGSPSTSSGKGKQSMNSRVPSQSTVRPSTSSERQQSSASSNKNVPKWFKLGKK